MIILFNPFIFQLFLPLNLRHAFADYTFKDLATLSNVSIRPMPIQIDTVLHLFWIWIFLPWKHQPDKTTICGLTDHLILHLDIPHSFASVHGTRFMVNEMQYWAYANGIPSSFIFILEQLNWHISGMTFGRFNYGVSWVAIPCRSR